MKNSKWVWWGVIGLLVVYLIVSGISRHVHMNTLAYDLQHGSQTEKIGAAKELMKRDRLYDKVQEMPEESRTAVMEVMELIAGEESVKQCLILLKDESEDVRERVTEALVLLGRDHKDILVPAIRDSDENVRNGAKNALVELGTESIPLVQEAVEEPTLRGHAFEVLVNIGEPSVPAVVELLKHKDQDVRMAAANALAGIGSEKATPALMEATKDTAAVRRVAISALCTITDPRAEGLLISVLHSTTDDGEVRARAARALSVIGTDKAISALTDSLADWDLKVRTSVISGLQSRRIGARVVGSVTATMATGSQDVRRSGAQVLEKIDAPEAASALLRLIGDSDPAIRASAARGLGNQTSDVRVDVLIALLSDSDGTAADAAADSLANLARSQTESISTSAMSGLVGVIRSSTSDEAKLRASEALGRTGKPAIPFLKNALEADGGTAKWAAYALGRTEDPAARSALEKFKGAADPDLAWVVKRALDRL